MPEPLRLFLTFEAAREDGPLLFGARRRSDLFGDVPVASDKDVRPSTPTSATTLIASAVARALLSTGTALALALELPPIDDEFGTAVRGAAPSSSNSEPLRLRLIRGGVGREGATVDEGDGLPSVGSSEASGESDEERPPAEPVVASAAFSGAVCCWLFSFFFSCPTAAAGGAPPPRCWGGGSEGEEEPSAGHFAGGEVLRPHPSMLLLSLSSCGTNKTPPPPPPPSPLFAAAAVALEGGLGLRLMGLLVTPKDKGKPPPCDGDRPPPTNSDDECNSTPAAAWLATPSPLPPPPPRCGTKEGEAPSSSEYSSPSDEEDEEEDSEESAKGAAWERPAATTVVAFVPLFAGGDDSIPTVRPALSFASAAARRFRRRASRR